MQLLELVAYSVFVKLKAEASRYYIGFIWWVLEPLLYLIAFYVLFVLIIPRENGDEFVMFFLCGVIVWKWFDSGAKAASAAINRNRSVWGRLNVPLIVFPLIEVVDATVKFVIVLIIFLLVLLATGADLGWAIVAVPLLILVQFSLIFSWGFLLSSIEPIFPDLKNLLPHLHMVLFFLSGVFFDVNRLSSENKEILGFNPLLLMIDGYRSAILQNRWPVFSDFLYIVSLSFVVLLVAITLVKLWRPLYSRTSL